MVVKIYISGISGNKEVKKRQQRVLMILDSKNVEYELIDITEPGKEDEKEFMQTTGIPRDSKYPLPPQLFNEEEYCGDYEDFDLANEMDELEQFLKVERRPSEPKSAPDAKPAQEIQENGNTTSREQSTEKDAAPAQPDSPQERTEAPSDTAQSEDVETAAEETSEVKTPEEEEVAEHMEDNADKNEEKSDDQEKEE